MLHHAAADLITKFLASAGCQLNALSLDRWHGGLCPASQRVERVPVPICGAFTLGTRLEARVPGAGELGADLRPGAADDVVRGLPCSVYVLQVVVVARQVRLHAIPAQQRLHPPCSTSQMESWCQGPVEHVSGAGAMPHSLQPSLPAVNLLRAVVDGGALAASLLMQAPAPPTCRWEVSSPVLGRKRLQSLLPTRLRKAHEHQRALNTVRSLTSQLRRVAVLDAVGAHRVVAHHQLPAG